jgi:hypothetical protein
MAPGLAAAVLAPALLVAVLLVPRSAAAAGAPWGCGGGLPSSGALAARGPSTSPVVYFALSAMTMGSCSNSSGPTTNCPISGLSLSWTDAAAKAHALSVSGQYGVGLAATLEAGKHLAYACAAQLFNAGYDTNILGGIPPTNFGCGLPLRNNSAFGNGSTSGTFYLNGTGAAQSLMFGVTGATATSGPMSGLVLQWIDAGGAGHAKVLAGKSAAIALSLGNGEAIKYSCAKPIEGQFSVAPLGAQPVAAMAPAD